MADLRGKGLWGYVGWDLERALQIAADTQATHILYKVGQGPLSNRAPFYQDNAAAIAQRIRDAGLIPFAWTFLTLGDPDFEADMVTRAFNDGYEGFIFDMEGACSRRGDAASKMIMRIQDAGVDQQKLYLCSYPNIRHHLDLPYKQLVPFCEGGLMPMAYGTFQRPPEVVIDQWTYEMERQWLQEQGLDRPVYPALAPYYDEAAQKRMTAQELQAWLERVRPYAPTFISFYRAGVLDVAHFAPIRGFALGDPAAQPRRYWVKSRGGAVVFKQPGIPGTQLHALPYGTELNVVGSPLYGPDSERWLPVRTGWGDGYVRLTHLTSQDPGPWPPPPTPPATTPGVLVQIWSTYTLNLRREPLMAPTTLVGCVPKHTLLHIVRDNDQALGKIGKPNEWLRVRVVPDGPEVWVSAEFVTHIDPRVQHKVTARAWVNKPEDQLAIHAGPSETTPVMVKLDHAALLNILEPAETLGARIGKPGFWIRVRSLDGKDGYAQSEYLALLDIPPSTSPADPTRVTTGLSPWIFGLHLGTIEAATDLVSETVNALYSNVGRTGWIMFSQAIGDNAQAIVRDETQRARLWTWARQRGHGVIVELNYSTGATLPTSDRYDAYAAACARWCELHLKREDETDYTWVIVIGNSPNDPSRHPGGKTAPQEHITPQRYAQAFNKVYAAIKAVLPQALVVPAPIFPYSAPPLPLENNQRIRPLDYFTQMIGAIAYLDGIALQTYTHGQFRELITEPTKLSDPLLADHYADFQAYRSFMDKIPQQYRALPVFITATHPICRATQRPAACTDPAEFGWRDEDNGWVNLAYDEIANWNLTPGAQQIQAMLLYTWQGDAWAFANRLGVQTDYRRALYKDYRWNEAPHPPIFSQRDPRWKNTRYSPSGTATFGQAGCLVTALASLAAWAGYDVLPPVFAQEIGKAGAFEGDYLNKPTKVTQAYPRLIWHTDKFFAGKATSYINWRDKGKLPDLELLQWILARYPVAAEVDFRPSTTPHDQHFVLAIRYIPDPSGGTNDDLIVMDPWTGTIESVLNKYFNADWINTMTAGMTKVGRTITGLRVFEVKR